MVENANNLNWERFTIDGLIKASRGGLLDPLVVVKFAEGFSSTLLGLLIDKSGVATMKQLGLVTLHQHQGKLCYR